VERQKFISVGLSKYMEFRKKGIEQSAMKMIPYVEYLKKLYCICQNHCLIKVGHYFGRLLAFPQLEV
jgi:hypothetical protein